MGLEWDPEGDAEQRKETRKRILLTGATGGIGRAIARALAERGGVLVLSSRKPSELEELAGSLPGDGHSVAVADLAEPDAALELAAAATADGPIDVLLANAGLPGSGRLEDFSAEEVSRAVRVNLEAPMLLAHQLLPAMIERRSGHLLFVSSLSGKVGMVGQTNYSAAKAGIVGLTKAAAKEMAHHGVRVNAIQPGLIRSAMTEAMPQKAWDQKMSEIPMGRPGEVDEIASVALFLASDMSSYVTGAVLEVTGGRFM